MFAVGALGFRVSEEEEERGRGEMNEQSGEKRFGLVALLEYTTTHLSPMKDILMFSVKCRCR